MPNEYGEQPPVSTGTTAPGGPTFSPGELPATGSDFDMVIVGGILLVLLGLFLLGRSIFRGDSL